MNLVLYPLKNKGTVKEDNMQLRFFRCEHCGNIIAMVKDTGVPVFCCGQKMTELVAGTVEASAEKHIPVCTAEGGEVKVNVGSAEHPMAGRTLYTVDCFTDGARLPVEDIEGRAKTLRVF